MLASQCLLAAHRFGSTQFKVILFPLISMAAGEPLSVHVAWTNESHVATQATFAHAQSSAEP